jgi:hypothetical protein
MSATLYGFMGYFVYSALSGTRLFAELHRDPLEINIFDGQSLEPVAVWSLGIALYFVGGVTLSLVFLPWLTLRTENLIAYIPATLAPVIVFFLNMQTIHSGMVRAKKGELQTVRANLVAASLALRELPPMGQEEKKKVLLASITAWEAQQKRVKALPEWPYTVDIKRDLVLSSLLPAVVGFARGLLPELLQRFVPPEVLRFLKRWMPMP